MVSQVATRNAHHAAADTEDHGEHAGHHEIPENVEPKVVLDELVATTSAGSTTYKRLAWALGIISVAGIAGFVGKLIVDGGDQTQWGYVAAILAFLYSAMAGAPLVAVAPVLAKANWSRPLTRIAAICSFASVICTIVMIPLMLQLPQLVTQGARRRSIWFEGNDYSPHIWSMVAMLTLILAGLALFYSAAIPDFAAMRDHATGWRQRLGRTMARGWIGTSVQWRTMRMRIGMAGTLYFFTFVFVHFIISTDYGMSMVPGWRDAIFPMYHAISSIQAGLAVTVLAIWIARRYLKLEKFLHLDAFWSLSRLMFAFTLLWGYFFISAFIVFWYGRSGSDKMWIDLLIRGPYLWVFLAAAFFIWFSPWWWMIWNAVRRSYNGPAIGSVLILIGLLLDRVRLYVAAWSVDPERIHERFLTVIPEAVWPDVWDVLIGIGAVAASILLVVVMTRAIPILSVWDVQQFNLLSRPINYMKTRVAIIAKPD